MRPKNINNTGAAGTEASRDKNQTKLFSDLELGRLIVTLPMFGQLAVYTKRDGRLGATVVCEEDGGKYGVTPSVLKYFSDVGTHAGWSYIDRRQESVFKFIVRDISNRPESLLAIETKTERVDVLSANVNNISLQHGILVAFYAKLAGHKGQGRYRRRATQVFPLDAGHPLLLTRLISGGRLTFPDYTEVLEMFFDALSNISSEAASQNRVQLNSALATLAANPEVPAQFQQLARVEQTKIASARTEQVNAPLLQHRGTGTGERKDTRIKPTSTTQAPAKSTVVGDVVQVKLQLD